MDEGFDFLLFLQKVIENNSAVSIVLIIISMCVWLIGGNMLDRVCAKRLGISPDVLPAFSFKHYNRREKIHLLGLFSIVMALGATGLFLN